MGYRSQPYDDSTELFPDRAGVERYIRKFAETVLGGKETRVDVRLGTTVNRIQRIQFHAERAKERIGWDSIWKVASINVESEKEEYDHVVIASGRCNTPTMPAVPGLDRFTGEMLHSAWWRTPLRFQGKTVQTEQDIYTPPHPTAPYLTNLDNWCLFYSPDTSIYILAAPTRIVPTPFTHHYCRLVWQPLTLSNPTKSSTLPLTYRLSRGPTTAPTTTSQTKGSSNNPPPPPSPQADNGSTRKSQDVEQSLRPVVARDEGWAKMPAYRNQRRSDTKRLRRLLLGY